MNFGPKLLESVVIAQLMDPGRRLNKIRNEVIKVYLGEGESASIMDMVPSQESRRPGVGKRTAGKAGSAAASGAAEQRQTRAGLEQRKMLQSIARKVLVGFGGSLGDTLNKEDPQGDGLLPIEAVSQLIKAKKIQALQPSELEYILV